VEGFRRDGDARVVGDERRAFTTLTTDDVRI